MNSLHTKIKMLLVLGLIWLANCSFMTPNLVQHTYHIIRNNEVIGKLQLTKQNQADKTYINLSSKVQSHIIVPINITSKDEALFNKGILLWSTVYREVNGKPRVNKKTVIKGSNYLLQDGNHYLKMSSYPITFNMMNLYLNEPETISQVYADAYQQFVPIKRAAQHIYRVSLPNGSYNIYEYKNNLCCRVHVFTELYEAVFELQK
jgi:hypothetical protein